MMMVVVAFARATDSYEGGKRRRADALRQFVSALPSDKVDPDRLGRQFREPGMILDPLFVRTVAHEPILDIADRRAIERDQEPAAWNPGLRPCRGQGRAPRRDRPTIRCT